MEEKWERNLNADYANTTNTEPVFIEGDGNNIINGNNNTINQGDTVINKSTDVINSGLDFDFENKTDIELIRLANNACLIENYDYAFDIYTLPQMKKYNVAMLNLGYIYENGLSYVGQDYDNAKECYLIFDCIEAERNLLSLYIKKDDRDDSLMDILIDLLWNKYDDITWDYIALSLFDESWSEYSEEQAVSKDEFTFKLNDLYEFEYTNNYYNGYNPPENTNFSFWALQSVDIVKDETHNYPCPLYREMKSRAIKNIELLDKLYYLRDDELIALN
jgi:hypothetical protein